MTQMEQQYAKYNNSKVLTASPAELTLMLYDGAIKFTNIAIRAIENKDVERAHNYIVKVERIIEEFRATLNPAYEVSKDFERVYAYLSGRLIQANLKKDTEILEEINKHLRSMRDNWKKVMEANQTVKAKASTAVNQ